jgi:osmotically-inducible protein OsmY
MSSGGRNRDEGRSWDQQPDYDRQGYRGPQRLTGGYNTSEYQDWNRGGGYPGREGSDFQGTPGRGYEGFNDWNQGGRSQFNEAQFNEGQFNQGRSNQGRSNQGQSTQGQFSGRGPRNYKRGDSRIEEDINERLTQHGTLDATDIEVSVQNGEVTLKGNVDNRQAKRTAEEIAEAVSGVKDVTNQIKVQQSKSENQGRESGATDTGKTQQRKAG